MSQIRCIYHEAPSFPASDQHPNAVRYTVGPYVVDAIGEPTLAEVEALLNPSKVPAKPDAAAILAALIKKGVITEAEARAEIK